MEELYDLEADPDEQNNIADDPSVCKIKMDLREKLKKWMIAQGDVHYSEPFFDLLPLKPCP
jgi:N-sulfoglucosamine sulfohydrolase